MQTAMVLEWYESFFKACLHIYLYLLFVLFDIKISQKIRNNVDTSNDLNLFISKA